jgi:hypothetical protein
MSAYDKVIFQDVRRFWKLVSYICNRPNIAICWRKKERFLSYSPIRHTLFPLLDYQKTRFLRGREKDISRVRLVLFIHIGPSKQPKMRLWLRREAMIWVNSRSSNDFLVWFVDWKCHLQEFKDMIFKRDKWPWKVIIILLSTSNYKYNVFTNFII